MQPGASDLALRRRPGYNLDGTPRKARNDRKWFKKGAAPPRRRRIAPEPKVPIQTHEAAAFINAEQHVKPVVLPKLDRDRPGDMYRAEFCDAVIAFMGQGYTLAAFCGALGVSRKTIDNWGLRHPEFVDAVHVGALACQKWWEEQLHEVAVKGTHTSGRVTAIVFALKNRGKADWSDIQRHEITGPGGMTLIQQDQHDLSRLSVEELVTLERITTKSLPAPSSEDAM